MSNYGKLPVIGLLFIGIFAAVFYVQKASNDMALAISVDTDREQTNPSENDTSVQEEPQSDAMPEVLALDTEIVTAPQPVAVGAQIQQTDVLRHIVKVQCENQYEISIGTGVVQVSGDDETFDWQVYTNAHVILAGMEVGGSCSIYIPVAPDYYPAIEVPVRISSISDSYPDIDFAILRPSDSPMTFADFPYNACDSTQNVIGDAVQVYGYPASGGSTLTVTEGIISGQEYSSYGPIFKVSAKIDTGNSGGVAINIDKQCSVGIPTWALSGDVEGLGYVQSWDMIYNAGDL